MRLNSLFLLIFFCFYLLNFCTGGVRSKNVRLELVQALFRHGMRTPLDVEAKYVGVSDPSFYGTLGFGELTNEGKTQLYTLGRRLREKYDEFLGTYRVKELFALSSNHDRTIASLQLVLAGLYPPTSKDVWNEKLIWNPIPFNHIPEKYESLFEPSEHVKFKRMFITEMAKSTHYQRQISKYTDYFKYVNQKLGISYESDIRHHSLTLYYGILIHKILNMPLPTWCTDSILQSSEELVEIVLDALSSSPKFKKLNGGGLIRRFIENINYNNNSTKPVRIHLYSGHDLTIAGFTRAQKIQTYPVFEIPTFGSAIIMEKYRDDQNVEYVRAVAWDGKDFTPLKIETCEEFCPLKKYLKIVENVIPSDEDLRFFDDNE